MLSSHALESKLKDPSKEKKDGPPSTRDLCFSKAPKKDTSGQPR